MICCYQITKFSARGTAPPLRLLHGALVILVRLQISQFRSFWEMSIKHCLPKSSRLVDVGSKDTSLRRTGVRVSVYWNFIIHQNFSEFLQPLRDVSTRRVAPFYRGFIFIWFWVFGWLGMEANKGSLKDENLRKNSMTSLEPRSERSSPFALYPNPVFNEMWFLTVDPLIRISVFIAKLSER